MGYLRAYRTPGGQRRFSPQQVDEFVASLEQGQVQHEHESDLRSMTG
jgi:hypothetical protein